ncbi:hypothetical protein CS022_05300 [Veronia nyctiphanis]|uniref:Xylulose kinase n=1 Tax=Veronia nyctiphanis TaxID=1278244 RepID=A0A4Q0YXX8_9GAMM|nr:hypothetical protein CS022_05300 [Veronia nyctiphanis]
MVADILNRPVTLLDSHNGAAFGAALQALWMLDGKQSISHLCAEHVEEKLTTVIEPNQENQQRYHREYLRFSRAVELVRNFY